MIMMKMKLNFSEYIVVVVALLSSLFLFSPTTSFPISTPWVSFLNLTGSHLGDHHPSFHLLKNYLRRFGYLPPPSSTSNFTDDFDENLQFAIKTYQENFHLDPTGHLDLPTITNLVSPRCGVADIINGSISMSSHLPGRHLYTYFPNNPTWPPSERHLTYAFTSTSAVAFSLSVLRPVFARAFGRWSAVTMLNFTEVGPAVEADITIGFYGGDHGDGQPFDGPLGTLAHAFSPTDGRFHLDAEEVWVAEGDVRAANSEDAVDMESVVVHEIGHLLGLGHSLVEESIMFPTITTRTRKVELSMDDVEGVQRLYGSNPNYAGIGVVPTTSTGNENLGSNDGGLGLRGLGWVDLISWVWIGVLYFV